MYLRGESQPDHEKDFMLISEVFVSFPGEKILFESECSKVKSEALHLGKTNAGFVTPARSASPRKPLKEASELGGSALLFGKG